MDAIWYSLYLFAVPQSEISSLMQFIKIQRRWIPAWIVLSFLLELPSTRTNTCLLKLSKWCLSTPRFLQAPAQGCSEEIGASSWVLPCTWNPTWLLISWWGLHPNVIGGATESISVTQQQEWLLLRSDALTQIATVNEWLTHFKCNGTQ